LNAFGVREAQVDAPQRLERADHESRSDEQHKGKRHLHDDQGALRSMAFAGLRVSSASSVEHPSDPRAGEFEGRDRSEEKT
jgi:hypothetical protein